MKEVKDISKEQISPIVNYILTLSYGDAVSHKEIQCMAGMIEPVITPETNDEFFKAEYSHFQLTYLNLTRLIRKVLLEEHLVYLKSVIGYGYKVLSPPEQLEEAIHIGKTGVHSQVRKARRIATYIDMSKLPNALRNRQTQALTAWAMVMAMNKDY